MRSSLVTASFLILSLSLSVPCAAQVLVVEQFADMECSAAAKCPGEEWPEADFAKRWLLSLDGVDESPSAEMVSACGLSHMESQLAVEILSDRIEGSFGASSVLDSLAGGYGTLSGYIQIRVQTPTTYSLLSVGSTLESGDHHSGGMAFTFSGGDIAHDSNGATDWDEQWQGVLQPGELYTLSMHASSSRTARELGGGDIVTEDGSTVQTVSFTLNFDATVVPANTESMGHLKAQY